MITDTQVHEYRTQENQTINRNEICLKILEINKSITEMNSLIFKELSTPKLLGNMPEIAVNKA